MKFLFDSLRKKLRKTIKDASDSIPEEELAPSEISEELDSLEADLKSIDEKYSEEPSEEKEEDSSVDVDKSEEKEVVEDASKTSVEEESIPDKEESKEETSTKEEKPLKEDETAEKEKEDSTEEDKDDSTKEDKDDSTEEEKESNKKKKGFFGFLRRNKKDDTKKEEKDETSEEKIEDRKTEEKEETTTKKEEEKVPETTEKPEQKKEKPKKEEKEEDKGGLFSFITKKTISEDDIEDILEELEMSLIEGDVAFDVAEKIVESVKEDLIGKNIKRRGDMELFTTNALKKAITEIIDNGHYDLLGDIESSKQKGEPYKIMFVGINGTGKTTTIAKMATYLEKHGYSSVFGASDTFRAGAIEQLEHHAKNLNLKIIKHERNSDPAAVAYDTVDHARATGKDVVLIDTSGRMQTNTNLMDEMKKIKRVSQPDIVIYVGDALMGNDATEQAYKFNEVIDVDGIILTKADADAKGGAALSIGHVINKPILFIGTGQSYDDLMEFEPEWMINQIFEDDGVEA